MKFLKCVAIIVCFGCLYGSSISLKQEQKYQKNELNLANVKSKLELFKDVEAVVNDPLKLDQAADTLDKISAASDNLINSNDRRDEEVRLKIYKTLLKKTQTLVQHLRTSVDEITIKTIPASAKILKFAQDFTAEPIAIDETNVRFSKFIKGIDEIIGGNLSSEDVLPWIPTLQNFEYLFWFEQCILPLVPETLEIRLSKRDTINYKKNVLISNIKSALYGIDHKMSKDIISTLQEKIKKLKVYNKNHDGPLSAIIFDGGTLSGTNINGLLESITQEERQYLESIEKSDKKASENPSVDATWWFSRETWNAILSIMQLSATVINVTQHIQLETKKIRNIPKQSANGTYIQYPQVDPKLISKFNQYIKNLLIKSNVSADQQKNTLGKIDDFLNHPDTSSARSLLAHSGSLKNESGIKQELIKGIEKTIEQVCSADTLQSMKESVEQIDKLPIEQIQKDYLIGFVNSIENPKIYAQTKLPPGMLVLGDNVFQEQVIDVMQSTCEQLNCHIIEIDGAALKTPSNVQETFDNARLIRANNNQKQFMIFKNIETFGAVDRASNPLDPRAEVVAQMLVEITKDDINNGLTWIGTSNTNQLDSALTRSGRFNIAITSKTFSNYYPTTQTPSTNTPAVEDREIKAKEQEKENDAKISNLVNNLQTISTPNVSVMLLKGPPGNGKGFTAKTLAKNANCLNISIDPYEIDSVQEVNDKFAKLKTDIETSNKQCFVILLDEIDSIVGFDRDDTSYENANSLSRRIAVTDTIISQIEKFTSNPPANKSGIIMAATNKPDNLDKNFNKLINPSLDIYLPEPSTSLRKTLLKDIYMKGQKNNFTNKQWEYIIQKTSGCSISTLVNIINDAIFLQKSQNTESKMLTYEIFEKAMTAMLAKNALIKPPNSEAIRKVWKPFTSTKPTIFVAVTKQKQNIYLQQDIQLKTLLNETLEKIKKVSKSIKKINLRLKDMHVFLTR